MTTEAREAGMSSELQAALEFLANEMESYPVKSGTVALWARRVRALTETHPYLALAAAYADADAQLNPCNVQPDGSCIAPDPCIHTPRVADDDRERARAKDIVWPTLDHACFKANITLSPATFSTIAWALSRAVADHFATVRTSAHAEGRAEGVAAAIETIQRRSAQWAGQSKADAEEFIITLAAIRSGSAS